MQVPLRPISVSAVRHLACPGSPVHAYGVCTAAESVHKRLASRMLRCPLKECNFDCHQQYALY